MMIDGPAPEISDQRQEARPEPGLSPVTLHPPGSPLTTMPTQPNASQTRAHRTVPVARDASGKVGGGQAGNMARPQQAGRHMVEADTKVMGRSLAGSGP